MTLGYLHDMYNVPTCTQNKWHNFILCTVTEDHVLWGKLVTRNYPDWK